MLVTIFTGKNRELVEKEMEALEENTLLYKDYSTMEHPSVMPQVVKTYIDNAEYLRQDVAFYSHSQEIIELIYRIAKPNVRLIRVTERDGKVYKTEFDSVEMEIAIDNDIDMR